MQIKNILNIYYIQQQKTVVKGYVDMSAPGKTARQYRNECFWGLKPIELFEHEGCILTLSTSN